MVIVVWRAVNSVLVQQTNDFSARYPSVSMCFWFQVTLLLVTSMMKGVYKFLFKCFRKFLFWCLGWFSLKSIKVLCERYWNTLNTHSYGDKLHTADFHVHLAGWNLTWVNLKLNCNIVWGGLKTPTQTGLFHLFSMFTPVPVRMPLIYPSIFYFIINILYWNIIWSDQISSSFIPSALTRGGGGT